jgi:Zn-dependent protease
MEAPLSPPPYAPERRPPPRRIAAPGGWTGIPLGRILGLQVRLDVSWLMIFALVSLSLMSHFARRFPGLGPAPLWIAALSASLLFFASILIHELSHNVAARARGVQVEGITLFMFGGVSMLTEDPRRPRDEFVIALVGPLASLALGAVFYSIGLLFPSGSLGRAAIGWLARINVVLAIFNLLPGFPLDGGRMLRAAAWALTGNLKGSTRLASILGSVVSFGLVAWGMKLAFWDHDFVGGLWLGLIGWFLLNASRRSVGQLELKESLRWLRVEQAMRTTCTKIPGSMRIDVLVDEFVFKRGERCFFVTENDVLRGMATLEEIRRVPREEWPSFRIGDLMIPFARVRSVKPGDSLLTAFEHMNEESVNQLPVVDVDHIAGVVTRDDIFRLLAKFLELTERPKSA